MGLPQLMRYMASRPDAQSAVDALLHGPFAHLSASACHIYKYEEPDKLVLYGGRGLEERVMARCQIGALDLRTPLTDAFLDVETTVMALSEMLHNYPFVRIADESLWLEYIERFGDQTLVCVPIVMDGIAVGGYSIFLPVDYRLTSSDCAVFDGIGALLGLWMTHEAQVRRLERMDFSFVDVNSVLLTERQLAILVLVDEGRSVGSITRALGYSQSTIRQELQKAMKALRVATRDEAAAKAKELGLHSKARSKTA